MKIVFIGAGNLATNLSLEFYEKGFEIVQIYSRTEKSASGLALEVGASFTTDLQKISAQADLYIISVKDDVIAEIAKKADWKNKLIVHTAGSISMDVFEAETANYGVFYPLQTFSKTKSVNFSNIPICIEANSDENLEILKKIASEISTDVRKIDSQQRKKIHLSAVFACNFTNHLFAIAEEILEKENVSFDILNSLLEETLDKALKNSPKKVQTGPAVRKDEKVMSEHLALLKENDNFANIYKVLSKSIKKNSFDLS